MPCLCPIIKAAPKTTTWNISTIAIISEALDFRNKNSVMEIPWIAIIIHKNLPRTDFTFPNVIRTSHIIENKANNPPIAILTHSNIVGMWNIIGILQRNIAISLEAKHIISFFVNRQRYKRNGRFMVTMTKTPTRKSESEFY